MILTARYYRASHKIQECSPGHPLSPYAMIVMGSGCLFPRQIECMKFIDANGAVSSMHQKYEELQGKTLTESAS